MLTDGTHRDRREHQSAALRHDYEPRRLSRVQPSFGGTTDIQKQDLHDRDDERCDTRGMQRSAAEAGDRNAIRA